jgi:hypothetical protein
MPKFRHLGWLGGVRRVAESFSGAFKAKLLTGSGKPVPKIVVAGNAASVETAAVSIDGKPC